MQVVCVRKTRLPCQLKDSVQNTSGAAVVALVDLSTLRGMHPYGIKGGDFQNGLNVASEPLNSSQETHYAASKPLSRMISITS